MLTEKEARVLLGKLQRGEDVEVPVLGDANYRDLRVREDTLRPAWSETCEVTVVGGSTLGLDMFDADIGNNDLISTCDVDLTAELLRNGRFRCANADETRTLSAAIRPLVTAPAEAGLAECSVRDVPIRLVIEDGHLCDRVAVGTVIITKEHLIQALRFGGVYQVNVTDQTNGLGVLFEGIMVIPS